MGSIRDATNTSVSVFTISNKHCSPAVAIICDDVADAGVPGGAPGGGIVVVDAVVGNSLPVVGVTGDFPNMVVVAVLIDSPPKGVVGVVVYIDDDANKFRFAVGSIY